MAKPSISMPDDVYDELQERILMMKAQKSLPDKRMRSKVITEAVRDMLENVDDYDAWAKEHGLKPESKGEGESSGNNFVVAD